MRPKPSSAVILAVLVLSAPAMACSPPTTGASSCTAVLTITSDGDGFTIVPKDEPMLLAHVSRTKSMPQRLGNTIWLDGDLMPGHPPVVIHSAATTVREP